MEIETNFLKTRFINLQKVIDFLQMTHKWINKSKTIYFKYLYL